MCQGEDTQRGLKLAIKLCFLATGMSNHCLVFSSRMAHNMVSLFVPQLCILYLLIWQTVRSACCCFPAVAYTLLNDWWQNLVTSMKILWGSTFFCKPWPLAWWPEAELIVWCLCHQACELGGHTLGFGPIIPTHPVAGWSGWRMCLNHSGITDGIICVHMPS